MAVNHYLLWMVLLAAPSGTMAEECEDEHHCTVGLNLGLMNPDDALGFLVPQMCCKEVHYPFTFQAHFYNTSDYTITFHLHEFYLLDVEVKTLFNKPATEADWRGGAGTGLAGIYNSFNLYHLHLIFSSAFLHCFSLVINYFLFRVPYSIIDFIIYFLE